MKSFLSIALVSVAFSSPALALDLPVVGTVPVSNSLPLLGDGTGGLPVVSALGLPALPGLNLLDSVPASLSNLPTLGPVLDADNAIAGGDLVQSLLTIGGPVVDSVTGAGLPVVNSTLQALPLP